MSASLGALFGILDLIYYKGIPLEFTSTETTHSSCVAGDLAVQLLEGCLVSSQWQECRSQESRKLNSFFVVVVAFNLRTLF